jgi:CheY-specific phosphatase CheX
MLGEDDSEIDSDLLDGVGELVNMIAGTAKTTLGNGDYHFDLSIPAVLEGAKAAVTPQTKLAGLQLNCRCGDRELVLAIWTKGIGSS